MRSGSRLAPASRDLAGMTNYDTVCFAGMTDLSAENTPTRQLFNSNQQKKIYRFVPQVSTNKTIIKAIYVKQLVQNRRRVKKGGRALLSL